LIEGQRFATQRREDQAGATPVIGEEGTLLTTAPQFITAAAPHERIEVRIQRKEHPEVAVTVDPKDDQVAVLLGLDLDPHLIPRLVVTAVEGDEHLRRLRSGARRPDGEGDGGDECKHDSSKTANGRTTGRH
jgi:hypothetical protein